MWDTQYNWVWFRHLFGINLTSKRRCKLNFQILIKNNNYKKVGKDANRERDEAREQKFIAQNTGVAQSPKPAAKALGPNWDILGGSDRSELYGLH